MSDPRFARLKTDPRFRRPRKQQSKVVVDERFKEIFDQGKNKTKKGASKKEKRVDKYGRPVSDTHERDNLRRFYRLENEDDEVTETKATPDYARGEVILESSDEENADQSSEGDDSDQDRLVTFGLDHSRPIPVLDDAEGPDIDLDESSFADLDAQAASSIKALQQEEESQKEGERTCRLAAVNLDWDHVRAIHLFKIFSSLVSPTAPAHSSTLAPVHPDRQSSLKGLVIRGKVLSVRVYPSEFGKERLAREEKEGPPVEVFKKKLEVVDEEEVNEKTVYDVGDGQDYDEDALRKYQLERLRYYYAIATCDTVEVASHIYSELEGTELERSANVFDLSFVPDDMSFDDDCRDEATEDLNIAYKGIDFVTDALRHSKVKLTWDEDDPERNQITRRALSRQEIEEADFRAYLASSESESEDDGKSHDARKGKSASRDKLRALLLGGGDDDLPEGWGKDRQDGGGEVDMEITFTPGLSEAKDKHDEETTLEKYQRKMKEKRKKRKEKEKAADENALEGTSRVKDDFFAEASDSESEEDDGAKISRKGKGIDKGEKCLQTSPEVTSRPAATPEELALLVGLNDPDAEPKHFNLKSVLKSEKKSKSKRKKGKKQDDGEDQELQEDFAINVKDDRFKAMHEDHTFAIDPSNPHFKKTKSMAALLEERSKRQKEKGPETSEARTKKANGNGERSLQSLVESVKRKSAIIDHKGTGKRRRV